MKRPWRAVVLVLLILAVSVYGGLRPSVAEAFAASMAYTLYRGVISPKEARTLATMIFGHPYVRRNQHLNSEGFAGTRGFVLHFTKAAAEKTFAGDANLAPYARYFVKLYEQLQEFGNAFVFNVLVCPPGKKGIDWHQDNTLDLWKRREHAKDLVPDQVAILYVQMPDEGGEIELFTEDDPERIADLQPRDTVLIAPRAGDVLVFDGSMYHRVHPHKAQQPRISIVLEAYKLPGKTLPKLHPSRVLIPRHSSAQPQELDDDFVDDLAEEMTGADSADSVADSDDLE